MHIIFTALKVKETGIDICRWISQIQYWAKKQLPKNLFYIIHFIKFKYMESNIVYHFYREKG